MSGPALAPAELPTLYFIGVTTGQSSILRIFPKWAEALQLGPCRIVGVDLPIHAPREEYRRVVSFIRDDPRSRGALVTTHKIDVFEAANDLFEAVDPLAATMGELSCISKAGGRFTASAKDPISSRLALEALLPPRHFEKTGAELLAMGAGGATIAITWCLMRDELGPDRPSRIVITDRSEERLGAIRTIHARFGFTLPTEYLRVAGATDNDAAMAGLKPGSLVINATGLGKDGPGSPVGDAAPFPENGFAWELNYRGDLVFLRQAREAAAKRGLTVGDGWVYFLHGWTRVIADVFECEIPTSGPLFERLSELAGGPPIKERAA